MPVKNSLVLVLMTTTMLAAGAAFAADQSNPPPVPANQTAVDKDVGKLSADGSKAFSDVAMTRLAIFDGRVADAKKYINEADSALASAKTDESVFKKAESQFKTPDQKAAAPKGDMGKGDTANNDAPKTDMAKPDMAKPDMAKTDMAKTDMAKTNMAKTDMAKTDMAKTDMAKPDTGKADMAQPDTVKSPGTASDAKTQSATAQPAANGDAKSADTNQVKAWLPVDGELVVNEDFSADPAKAAAVADANQKLASGDKTGAMQRLKVASVDVDFIMAVVPLDQTINDVHQAATLVNSGKYYEASQALRQVQDSTRYDMLDISSMPKGGAPSAPTTH